jgi:hypothetical protein
MNMPSELQIEVYGSQMNGWNIFEESSFHGFIPEGYMIHKIVFHQEEESSYHWSESVFIIIARKIGG